MKPVDLITLALCVAACAGCVGSATESRDQSTTALLLRALQLNGFEQAFDHPPKAVQLPAEPTTRQLLDPHLKIGLFDSVGYQICGGRFDPEPRQIWALVASDTHYRPIDDLIDLYGGKPPERYFTVSFRGIETDFVR